MQNEIAFYNFLLNKPDLQTQLQNAGSTDAMAVLAVQIGAANGFEVSADTITEMFLIDAEGELSDEQLDNVSGSGCWCCGGACE
ncbi:MAG: Nif11 family protein [Chloroflexota bacterium]